MGKPPPSRPRVRTGRVAIVGRPNVGKSTLLNALVGEHLAIVTHKPQTTRERLLGVVTQRGAQLELVDTPGLHAAKTALGKRMNEEAHDTLSGADTIVFVTDVTKEAPARVRADDAKLLAELPKGVPVILAVNKVDRVKEKSRLFGVLDAYAQAHPFKALVPISAKKEDGLLGLLKEMRSTLSYEPPRHDPDTLTDKPLRFFAAEFVREQVLLQIHQEVPHGVAVEVERFEESKTRIYVDVVVHVERPSHKRIVIGEGGKRLKAIGTAARARLEELAGCPVMLKIWVRVTPDWTTSPARLSDLGYGPIGLKSARKSQ